MRLQIYDVLGRKMATLLDEQVDAGYYRVRWNAANQVASGVYFYVLDGESVEGNEFRKVKKMLLIK